MKLLVARDRPSLPPAIDTAERGFAFPPRHSLTSLALYGALSYLAVQYLQTWRSRTYVVAGLLTTAVAVATSRLYLGYHWLSDVLGSWTLACLAGHRHHRRPHPDRAARPPAHDPPPGARDPEQPGPGPQIVTAGPGES